MKTKRFFPLPSPLHEGWPFAAALTLAIFIGGTPAPGEEALPQKPPGIAGTITSIGEGGRSVLVEARPGEKSGSPKALVRITEDTRLLDAKCEPLQPGTLKAGLQVHVWFKGPVAESYPAIGTGAVIQVLP